jgi:two-component system, OmpR family, phosphate regulon sensor histidine kinase PhoR
MSYPDELTIDSPSELELTHRQVVKYGQDLARVYVAEKAKREELEVAYQALSAIFASTPDSLVVLDHSFNILQANAAFARLVEMPSHALDGRAIDEVLLAAQLLPALHSLTAEDTAPVEVELKITVPAKRSLLANIARLQAGRVRGWIIVLRDQTNRKRLEYQKTEFINIASHELRTPLGAVMGYGELLMGSLSDKFDQIGDEPRMLLESVIKGANRLNGIVNELIHFAEINQGDLQPQGVVEFSLCDLVQDVVADLQQVADDKGVDLQVATPDVRLVADSALLRTAVYQLTLNAINFNTSGGFVRIEADEAAGQVTVRVVDSGIGIAQADLDGIFRPFFQVEHPDTRRVGGLGLGLSIVQRAASLLNGTISVESVLGKGTTFSLQIPAARVR